MQIWYGEGKQFRMKFAVISYHPTAPRRTASDCFALVNVSSGNGTPTRSKATPPIGNSSKLKSISDMCRASKNSK